MRKMPFYKIGCLVFIIGALILPATAGVRKIVVKVDSANVRLEPSMTSPTVSKAPLGLILDIKKKTGDWYMVALPPDEKGTVIEGYLHKSVVQEFDETGGTTAAPKDTAREKSVKPRPAKTATKRHASSGSEAGKKFFARLGAGYGSKSFDYSRSRSEALYQEYAQLNEAYSVDASGAVFEIGAGYMFTPQLGVEVTFVPASGKSNGTFSASFPHPFYYNNPRTASWTKSGLKYSLAEVNIDALYSLPVASRMKLFFVAGGTYFAKVGLESLNTATPNEVYPYFDVTVTSEYAKYSASAFGFNAGAGLEYGLSDSLALALGVRYASATAKIDLDGEKVSVPAGGVRATIGIKLIF
jgi:opacity protein-like surface antigen